MNIDKAFLPSLTFLVFAKRILIKHFHQQSTSSSWESEKNNKSTPLSGSNVGGKQGVNVSDLRKRTSRKYNSPFFSVFINQIDCVGQASLILPCF